MSGTIYLSAHSHAPILTLHGLATTTSLFDPLVPYLTEHAPVLNYDLDLYIADGKPHLMDYLQQIKTFLDENHIDEDRRVTVLGHGEGAFLALHFASLHPELIESLVLLCPVLPPTTASGQSVLESYQILAAERNESELAQVLSKTLTSAHPAVDGADELREKVRVVLEHGLAKHGVKGFGRLCRVMQTAPPPSYAPLVNLRSLIVFGNPSRTHVPISTINTLYRSLNGDDHKVTHALQDLQTLSKFGWESLKERRWERETKVLKIENGGHWLPLEMPDELGKIVLKFLRGEDD